MKEIERERGPDLDHPVDGVGGAGREGGRQRDSERGIEGVIEREWVLWVPAPAPKAQTVYKSPGPA